MCVCSVKVTVIVVSGEWQWQLQLQLAVEFMAHSSWFIAGGGGNRQLAVVSGECGMRYEKVAVAVAVGSAVSR